MSRVGQLFGKLFPGRSSADEAVLRAYGKLPLYAEYRRLEVSPGAPTVFSQWLDEGRLAWVRSNEEGAHGTTRSTRVVLHWAGGRERLVASIWDSRDSLGRVFPFAFFIVCPREWLGKTRLQRWVSSVAIHEFFDRAHARLAILGTGGDFYRLYHKQSVPTQPPDCQERAEELLGRARQITLEKWFGSAGLDEVEPGEWFAGLLRRAERWKAQKGSLDELALSCPLARGIPYEVQAVLWLEWVAKLAEAGGKEPWVVLPTADGAGAARLQIGFRDLLPGDFQLLTTDADTYGYVEDLARVPGESEASEGNVSVALPAGSLLDALRHHAAQ